MLTPDRCKIPPPPPPFKISKPILEPAQPQMGLEPMGSLSRREAERCLSCNATRLYDDEMMCVNA